MQNKNYTEAIQTLKRSSSMSLPSNRGKYSVDVMKETSCMPLSLQYPSTCSLEGSGSTQGRYGVPYFEVEKSSMRGDSSGAMNLPERLI